MADIYTDTQSALPFVIAQGRNIETKIYEKRYPNSDYRMHIPVVIEGQPWAIGTTFFTVDYTGKAGFISGSGADMPLNGVVMDEGSHDYSMIGSGWEWNIEQVNQARLHNRDIQSDRAMSASKNLEWLLYDIAMTGATEKNWTGLVNDAAVSRTDVATTGTASSTLWANKTDDKILKDVNDLLSSVPKGSKEAEEVPNTLRLPPDAFRDISTRKFGGGNGTLNVLEFLRKNNIYTAYTGQALDIMPLRSLATASSDGGGRMMVYRKDAEVLRFHMPMPRRVLQPRMKSIMGFESGIIARTGGVEIRVPSAMAYGDEITAVPT